METEETREIIIQYFNDNELEWNHNHNMQLVINGNNYQIRPDDAFYHNDRVLLFEYEKNQRPVESISKYFWLFRNTNWLEENVKTKLLLTINRENINQIRIQSIPILGNILSQQYPNSFDFHFLSYDELTEENLRGKLTEMMVVV